MRSGKREGAGRNPAPEHLKKVPYNTKLHAIALRRLGA